MINEVQEILINESEIQEKVKYLAEQINKDYAGKDIVLMIILKGSVVFSADLMRYLNVNVSLDFMQVSSYGSSSVSGELKILKDGQIDVNGKNVIIAEDIIDSGNTLSALVKLLKKRGANVEICTLLSKPARRETQVDVKYEGFEIPDEFVVGYLSPDIVAIVGDMNLESQPDNYSSVISLCKQLNEIAPVYYCLGNHEIDAMLFKNSNIYKDIKAEGIKIFNNETETVNIGGTAIDIIGLTQNPTEFDEYGKDFFEKAISADDNFKLLLTHYPEYFLGKLNDYDIDLAITGHAHGGQVRLPFIGGLYAADQGLFPKLCDGYHEDGNSKFIVSRGLGKSGIVPRINNKPEIVIADISWY